MQVGSRSRAVEQDYFNSSNWTVLFAEHLSSHTFHRQHGIVNIVSLLYDSAIYQNHCLFFVSDIVNRLRHRSVLWLEESGQFMPVMHIGWHILDCSYGAARKSRKTDDVEAVSVLLSSSHWCVVHLMNVYSSNMNTLFSSKMSIVTAIYRCVVNFALYSIIHATIVSYSLYAFQFFNSMLASNHCTVSVIRL